MKNYIELLQEVLEKGSWKDPARKGMPRTKELFGRMLKFDLQEGFPAVTSKKLFFKGVIAELLWFMNGDTNIKTLIDQNVHIWDDDGYRFYVQKMREMSDSFEPMSKEQWLEVLANADKEPIVDLGNIYGKQWRRFGEFASQQRLEHVHWFDQLQNCLESIRKSPNSRYHVVMAWNPIAFLRDHSAALPACHMIFQFSVRENKYLDLSMLQRSCDMFLGVPFNIAFYAALVHIFCRLTGYLPGEFTWFGNSVHIYEDQISQAEELVSRKPFELPKLHIDGMQETFEDFKLNEFSLLNYKCHPPLKAPLSTGAID